MKSHALSNLQAVGGELYAHVFENARTGLPQSLYWSVTIAFEPVVIAGSPWETSMTCEWLAWPIRRWTQLDGRSLDEVLELDLVETSFYLAEHQLGSASRLQFRRSDGAKFDVAFEMEFDLVLPDGGNLRGVTVKGTTSVPFDGVYVLPKNLSRSPDTEVLATDALAEFLNPADFHPASWDRFRYVFSPTASAR
jgi:hypothetical protein